MNSAPSSQNRHLRVVFMGTADVACPCLRALIADPDIDLVGVITQPDRPQGRGRHPQPCAVRRAVDESAIALWTPHNVNQPEILADIRRLSVNVIVVMAYGQFLDQPLLDQPPLGCINVHLSLLPRYRGAAPIQWAIANGESETGVTFMRMIRRMDAGDILDQAPMPIQPDDTTLSLATRLSHAAAQRLPTVVHEVAAGTLSSRPQDERQATYAPLIKKDDGIVDWSLAADAIERRIRAFTPWPGCTTLAHGRRLRILQARVCAATASDDHAIPGAIVDADSEGPVVQTGNGCLQLLNVQPEGRRAMTGHAFMCGYRLRYGVMLG